MKKWFEISLQADGAEADVYVFGIIGDWIDDYWGDTGSGIVTAKSFVEELAKLPPSVKTIKVRINSPGGDVFGGITIANVLRAEQTRGRNVETIVEGLAASAASIIAMGGKTVRMADNAMMMVHSPWSIAIGNAREMRAVADELDKIRVTLVKTYQWHSQLTEDEILGVIDGEDGQGTWMDAAEAYEKGFATEVIEGLKAAASIDPHAAGKLKVPTRFADRIAALVAKPEDKPAPVEDRAALDAIVPLARAAGLDIEFAAALAEEGLPMAEAQARVSAEKEKRAAEDSRQEGIRALCKVGKCDGLAADLIAGGTSVEAARGVVAKVTAMVDKVEIDAGIVPDQGAGGKKVIDVQAVYAQRNQLRK